MKAVFIFLMLVVILPFSSAFIEIISQLDNEYNLGDNIDFSVKIVPDKTTNALVKLTLKCTNKDIIYYIAPIELERGKEINVNALPIKAFSKGLCDIRANVESLEGDDLEGITSKEFTISDKLGLSFNVDKTEVSPGDKIKIKGNAGKGGNKIDKGSIVIKLDNKKGQIELDKEDFSYELELDKNIKSGEHTLIVQVNDSYGNYNEESSIIEVEAVPTRLEFYLNRKEFLPKDTLEFIAHLSDQAEDSIQDDIKVKLFKKKTLFQDEIVIFDSSMKANTRYYYIFNYSTLPYDYILKGNYGELEKEGTITILPYPKIEMKLDGDMVTVKNVGNVKYNNETTIVLEKEDKTYIINKKIKLDVGEETMLDLSKEVPSGSYTVTLPPETITKEKVVEKLVPENIKKEIAEDKIILGTTQGLKADNVIENVEIEDNRPLYKKGFNFITGGVIAGAGVLLNRPKLASFTMIIIILSTIGYFNRKRIEKIIKKVRERREKL